MGLIVSVLGSAPSAFAYQFKANDVVTEKPVSFPNAKAKGTVVVFISAKCPCSASHEAILNELAKEYSKDGFEFIGVHANQDESKVLASSHFKNSNLSFPVVNDAGAKIANAMKALKTPHVFIIQKDKIVYEGGVDDSADAAQAEKHFLKDALQELKADKPVTLAKARALGCVIKR